MADLGDDVLEVGPGPGLTTDLLRQRVAKVTAVELDEQLATALAGRLAGTNVDVVHADAADSGLPASHYLPGTPIPTPCRHLHLHARPRVGHE